MSSDDLSITCKQGRVCKLLILHRAKSISDRLLIRPEWAYYNGTLCRDGNDACCPTLLAMSRSGE